MDPKTVDPGCPPARSDWRPLDKDSEEFKAYYLQRQREVARYKLDYSHIPGNMHLKYWQSMDEVKKEETLDRAMQGHPVRPLDNLDDYVTTARLTTFCVFAVIEDIIFKPAELKQKGTSMPLKKGANSLLRKAIVNNQSRK